MRLYLAALAALSLFACGGPGVADYDESDPVPYAASDPAEVERQREHDAETERLYPPGMLQDAFERERGVTVERLDHDDSLERFMNDQPGGEEEDEELVEKGLGNRWPALTGWAVLNVIGQDSQGANHFYPIDWSYQSAIDAIGDLLGRCGRSGTQKEYSWFPCVLPNAQDPSVGAKIKKWMFKKSTCPAGALRDDIYHEGIRRAFTAVNAGANDWIFNETTSEDSDTYVVQCGNAADVSDMNAIGSIARGTPYGPLTQSHFRVEPWALGQEGCEPEAATQAYWFNVDVVATYPRGLVTLNWDLMNSGVVLACSSNANTQKTIVRTIVLHELGHIFGFAHFLDNTQFSNIMQPSGASTCGAVLGGFGYRPNMNEALNLYSLPVRPGYILEVPDVDLSCYKPGSQPTQ